MGRSREIGMCEKEKGTLGEDDDSGGNGNKKKIIGFDVNYLDGEKYVCGVCLFGKKIIK